MTYVLIRLVHVLLGIFWGGTILFAMFFLDPAARAAGPAGGQVMAELQKRKYLTVMLHTGTVVVLTGFYVLWSASAGFDPSFMGSLRGMVLSTGMLTGILVLVVLFAISRPTAKKLGAVAQRMAAADGAPDPADVDEMQRLRSKLSMGVRVGGILMIVTLVCMVYGAHGA